MTLNEQPITDTTQAAYEQRLLAYLRSKFENSRRCLYIGDNPYLHRLRRQHSKGHCYGRQWKLSDGEYLFWPEFTVMTAQTVFRVHRENLSELE